MFRLPRKRFLNQYRGGILTPEGETVFCTRYAVGSPRQPENRLSTTEVGVKTYIQQSPPHGSGGCQGYYRRFFSMLKHI
jgi:hypothetical protein